MYAGTRSRLTCDCGRDGAVDVRLGRRVLVAFLRRRCQGSVRNLVGADFDFARVVLVTCRSRVICKKVASWSGTIGAQSED